MRMMCAAVLLSLSFAAQAAPAKKESVPTGPLPRTVEPLHYKLHLSVDPAQDSFSGKARIRVLLRQATSQIWLHGRDLDVSHAAVWPAQGPALPAKYEQVHAEGVAKLSFGLTLQPQVLELEFNYRAPYNGHLEGLYKVTRAGLPYIVTQMEAISARYAFPGFDEPAFKTPYEISLTVPEDLAAIANTRQTHETRDGKGHKTVYYATTRPLPTYLLALAVGPWDVVAGEDIPPNELRSHPVPLRALAPKGQGDKLRYALANTAESFQALERYFGIAYPFDKLDIAAVPDFSAGAMENAGLITYRDSLLLLDEKTSPVKLLQDFYEVHVHEMAHQWFGNLVTMPWWDDLWLNEAFATWMARKITGQLKPEYRSGLKTLVEAQDAMRLDGLSTARRVRNPIKDNGDIQSAFDGITYDKGGAVLGMFESWMGEDNFRRGIRDYLYRHQRGNARSDDLINALAAQTRQPALTGRAFRSFLTQAGVPLVSAQISCNQGRIEATLRQSRDLAVGSPLLKAPKTYWNLPVCLHLGLKAGSARECLMLETAQQKFMLDSAECPAWVMPNAGGTGYYRFQSDAKALAALTARAGELPPAEQIAFADSVAAAFDRGETGSAQVLAALAPLASSGLADVATALLPKLLWINDHAASPAEQAALLRHLGQLFAPRLQALGYSRKPQESGDDSLLRRKLLTSLALDFRLPEVRAKLLEQGEAALRASGDGPLKLDGLDANLLQPVLQVLLEERGQPVLEKFFAAIRADGEPGQRIALLQAIGGAQNPALGEAVRAFGLSEAVKIGETQRYYYSAHFERPVHQAAAWDWLQKNFDSYVKRVPVWKQAEAPEAIARTWCDSSRLEALRSFFKPRQASSLGLARSLASAEESVQLCAALKKKHGGTAKN